MCIANGRNNPSAFGRPRAETLEQAGQRIESAMTKLLKRHKEGVIALVLPEPMASLVRCYLDQGELGDLWKATSVHGQWETLEATLPMPAASH